MTLTLVTAPTTEPIDLPSFMLHAHADSSEENANFSDYIKAAREIVETKHNRQLMTATYDLKLDGWPEYIELSRPPIQSVTYIKYYDTAGVLQTLSSSVYVLEADARPPVIRLAYNQFWPAFRVQPQAIVVRYIAGYADAASVPSCAKQLIREMATRMVDQRSTEITGTIISEFQYALDSLAWNDAIFGYA